MANFPANTGYAWNFIEELFAGIANGLAPRGIATWVAYPAIASLPSALRGSVAAPVRLDVRPSSMPGFLATLGFIRRHAVRVVYLVDRPCFHPAYAAFRRAGVRRIIVHDHTSGERTPARGLRFVAKRLRQRLPGSTADRVIVVSDFVARRRIASDALSDHRVERVWNSVRVPCPNDATRTRLRKTFGLEPDRPVVACTCRAVQEKGVAQLMRAFNRLHTKWAAGRVRPVLIYIGDGPAMDALRTLRERLSAREDILLAGYREDALDLVAGSDLAVVPSLWQEAFGLAALEAMACGVPVIASRVGGLPEIVIHGETGWLVSPGDEAELAHAMRELFADPKRRRWLGENGRRRAATHFARERQIRRLTALVEEAFSPEMGED